MENQNVPFIVYIVPVALAVNFLIYFILKTDITAFTTSLAGLGTIILLSGANTTLGWCLTGIFVVYLLIGTAVLWRWPDVNLINLILQRWHIRAIVSQRLFFYQNSIWFPYIAIFSIADYILFFLIIFRIYGGLFFVSNVRPKGAFREVEIILIVIILTSILLLTIHLINFSKQTILDICMDVFSIIFCLLFLYHRLQGGVVFHLDLSISSGIDVANIVLAIILVASLVFTAYARDMLNIEFGK